MDNHFQTKAMLEMDRIKSLCEEARKDLSKACQKRNIEPHPWTTEYVSEHLEACREVWEKWHTTNNYKVGDKVYVVPLTPTTIPYCIRATVTEVPTDGCDGWGYHLRAFERDLPGIFMFNIWDKDLEPRVGKTNKPTPKHLLISR